VVQRFVEGMKGWVWWLVELSLVVSKVRAYTVNIVVRNKGLKQLTCVFLHLF